ncbi:MAG TPA: KR domain-containing protein, partial [Pyrinomonadaceae bacterium]
RRQVERLAGWAAGRDEREDCGDAAYTLTVGRRHMGRRVAVVAREMGELRRKLEAWLRGEGAASGVSEGDAEAAGGRRGGEGAAEAEERIQRCRGGGWDSESLGALRDLYVGGYGGGYERIYEGGGYRRVSLPTYAFGEEPYWVDDTNDEGLSANTREAERVSKSKQWLFTEEVFLPSVLALPQDWKQRVQSFCGRRMCVLAADRKATSAFADVLRRLLNLEGNGIGLDQLAYSELEHYSFKSAKPGVLFLLDSGGRQGSAGHLPPDVKTAFQLSQKLMRELWEDEVSICYLHSAKSQADAPASDALSGFARSAMLENPRHRWTVVGQDETATAAEAHQRLILEWLAADANTAGGAVVIQYRDGVRLVSSLVEQELPPGVAASFRHHGKYLIAGGLGPVGELLCRELAKRYQAHLFILSRGELNPERKGIVEAIEAEGGRITYLKADVADLDSLEAALAKVEKGGHRLNGVIHMARLVEDGLILNKSWESFVRVTEAKVLGTMNLDRVTASQPLDFFVLFSSMAAFGIRGSADYGYAAAYQNAYARYRRGLQRAGERNGASVSQCWGAWGVDRYLPENRQQTLAALGFDLIDIEAGFDVIEKACVGDSPVVGLVAVTDRDKALSGINVSPERRAETRDEATTGLLHLVSFWEQLRLVGGAIDRNEFAARLAPHDLGAGGDELVGRIHGLLFEDKSSPNGSGPPLHAEERAPRPANGNGSAGHDLAATILKTVVGVLQVSEVQESVPLQRYGVDSVAAIQIATRLEKELGRVIQPHWLMEFPTIKELAAHLASTAA